MARLLEIAAERPHFGHRRLHILLVREGWKVNHKRNQRMYCEERLAVRRKRRKRVAQVDGAARRIVAGDCEPSAGVRRP